jgi:aerobic carbon-monoxide dehydrogenase small subunit
VTVELALEVNLQVHHVEVEARETLLDVLRERLGLTGAHAGCEHGVCGACTVLLDGQSVRSCLMFAVQARGRAVTTIEGLSGEGGALHPVQEAFRRHHGLQCGYCTPGMVLAALELLEHNPAPDAHEIEEALAGNICRCTGYAGILDAIAAAAEARRAEAVG